MENYNDKVHRKKKQIKLDCQDGTFRSVEFYCEYFDMYYTLK